MSRPPKEKAIVLFSGGLDSATALAKAMEDGFEVMPLAFDYAQKNLRELRACRAITVHYMARSAAILPLRIVSLRGLEFGQSALTSNSPVPKHRDLVELEKTVAPTYVPCRNSIFISIAAAFAEAQDAMAVVTGLLYAGPSGTPNPDGRPEFVAAMELALMLGSKRGLERDPIRVLSPLERLSKADVVKEARRLKVPLQLTWSCYAGGELPCKACDACLVRAAAFTEVGVLDPALARPPKLKLA